jgi:eukaryotic-like serine/threonine-protein kinase
MMINNHIRLLHPIGRGATAEVWAAHHQGLRMQVAVKMVLEEALARHGTLAERLAREAQAMERIDSPHVARLFERGVTSDGMPYIVMERLHGKNLAKRLVHDGPLDPGTVLEVLRQTGAALDAAHAAGVVHRDVKPQNILLTQPRGRLVVKLLDFGSARLTYELHRPEPTPLTAPDVVLGSPAYLSRDVLLEPDDVDHRADLWALAVSVFKCLTGVLPFRGDDVMTTCSAILDGELARASRLRGTLSPSYDRWFARVFSSDPCDRPKSGAQMAASFARMVPADHLDHALPMSSEPAPSSRPSWVG